jgi:hypothetical protein
MDDFQLLLKEQEALPLVELKDKVKTLEPLRDTVGEYRLLQSLELTTLQSKILDAIELALNPDIPLRDLINAFKVLKEKEHLIEGKPTELKGLVHYLTALEDSSLEELESEIYEGELVKEPEVPQERMPRL